MFIQIIQGRCTRPEEARKLGDRWQEELAPGAPGWLGGTYGFTDDSMFVGVIRFDSRESAAANAARPEQSAWWADMEKCFDGPVEFHDCDDVTLWMDGGSDAAGFVQIIRGKVDDPARLKESMTGTDIEALHKARPEIIGATLAIEPDGTFTETVAFTDEASARRGEQSEMPPEAAEWETLTHDVSYIDLHEPWFTSRR